MNKLTFGILALATVSAMAGVLDPFKQFTKPENTSEGYYYADIIRAEQPNAPIIKMHVPEKSTVWLTHIVDTWNDVTLTVPDLSTVYDMGEHKYGYIYASAIDGLDAEKSTYQDLINWSSPENNIVTYTIDNPPEFKEGTTDLLEVKAKGYLLDSFDEATDIYLVMTPLNETEDVDSYQFADDGEGGHEETILESRKNSELDKASNIRVNFGIHTADEREFVAVYEKIETEDIGGGASGQPLPGLLLTGLLSLGTLAAGKRMKRRA